MGTTLQDAQMEIDFEEELERERREAFKALKNISNSKNTQELQNNLNKLKDVYRIEKSDLKINDDNIGKLISDLDFSMPELRKYWDKSERQQKLYFYVGLILSVFGIVLTIAQIWF